MHIIRIYLRSNSPDIQGYRLLDNQADYIKGKRLIKLSFIKQGKIADIFLK